MAENEAKWAAEFDRIVDRTWRERPGPVGPYMRWPLGVALVLMVGQVVVSVLSALAAAALLTAGHTSAVTTASLAWTCAISAGASLGLGWAAYHVRSRLLPALVTALVIETVAGVVRVVSLVSSGHPHVADYFALCWYAAAVSALAAPSSRAYCTRRRRPRPAR